jgi:DNA-binding MarR family transcriptional regulator
VLNFMRLLWSVDHGLRSYSKHMATSAGVTSPQRLVIRMVGRFPGVSAGKLAELLHVHPSTLTGVLDRLVRRGMLQRRGDPEDKRRALFELTARGTDIDQLRAGTVEDAVRRVMSRMSDAKLHAARDTLAELAKELDEPPQRASKAPVKRKAKNSKPKER